MDLIYANKQGEDIGVMRDYALDLAFGESENAFECQVLAQNNVCTAGDRLYIDGTEYGGIIDEINVDTEKDTITYKGRTWHGIIDSKIICPPSGQDYLQVSGDANEVIQQVLTLLDLPDLFEAEDSLSGVLISAYKFDRYISGYAGLCKMLRKKGAKLTVRYEDSIVYVGAKKVVDYSQDEEFDQDLINFEIDKNYAPTNHVICLGSGDLSERQVFHLYADENGNISQNQSIFGIEERVQVYDYPNAESQEELLKGGREILEKAYASDELDISFESDAESFDVGDIVGAYERTTGISVAQRITKKIVKIEDYTTTVSYEIGE